MANRIPQATQKSDNIDRLLEYINAQPNPRAFMLALLSLGANQKNGEVST